MRAEPLSLHHADEGPAGSAAVVLSGSLGTTLEMWDAQVEGLAGEYRVLRYDRRGHGRSRVRQGPYTIAELGADLVGLLDQLGLERVSFCGVSLGGAEGIWLASHAPERVERLVLACTAPRFPPRETWEERAALVRAEGTAAVAEATMERWFTPGFRAREPETVRRFRMMVEATPDEGYAACCDALAVLELSSDLPGIAAPTLVVNGELDPVVPPEVGAELAGAITGARQVVIAGAQHMACAERADAFNRALRSHLDD